MFSPRVRGGDASVSLYLANPTSLYGVLQRGANRKCKNWLEDNASQYHIPCFPECHLLFSTIKSFRNFAGKLNKMAIVNPSPPGNNIRGHAGCAILASNNLHFNQGPKAINHAPEDAKLWPGRFLTSYVKFRGLTVCLICIYLETSVGVEGSKTRLVIPASFIKTLNCH